MPDVFLSYKREDAAAAAKLVEGLRDIGLDVWWDSDIPAGAAWEATIERALVEAKVVIVCWSKAAVASDNVRSEARWAREQGRLIQLFVEPCSPPLFFGERQGLDVSDWSGDRTDLHFQRLVSEIRARLDNREAIPSGAAPITPESKSHAAEAPPATSSERRQITVMSVDLVGSTRLSAEIDPEVLADLQNIYRDRAAREITATGGGVAEHLGDGVLAYFGWPQAREDAAEAAIRAGFQVIAEVGRLRGPDGLPLQCRIGIATGLVVIGGKPGDGGAREVAIAGEALSLAAKLQALAPPDGMVIAEATHRQIGQVFECEALGEQSIAGLSVPVRAWRPLHKASHLSRFKASRAVRTSFIGRVHELSLLEDRWRTASEGTGRTVLILGEAGMGKSRLAEALEDRIAEGPHSVVIWQCSPYHQTKAFYPVVEYATHAAGIVDADRPAVRLEKLTRLLESVQMTSGGALALFAELLAIPSEAGVAPPALPPDQARAATIAALTEWMRRIALQKPLLFVLEDAHWIDATTLELLTRLIRSASDVPLLSVITARPEFASPWTGGAEVSIIGLDRLNNRDCEGLAREIAATVEFQADTLKEIVSRSDGNPLFVEELSAAVFETADSGQRVPDSLQSSLMARLDQLGDAKKTAQVCSVLGRRFARPLLMHVAELTPAVLDANLALLAGRDVIRPLGGAEEGRYEFKHALVRDAAYESLLLSQRRRLHKACGRHIERSFPEAARTEPELMAQHFRLAGLPEEAAAYAELAGDRAATAHAMVEAASSYNDAIRQAELLPEGPERDRRILALLLKLGPALAVIKGIQNPELKEIYRRAESLSRAVGDADALFKSVWGRWFNTNVAGQLDEAAAFAQELVVISGQSDDEGHKLEALHCRWSSGLFAGDCIATRQDSEHGIELYDRERHHRLGLIFGGHDPGVCAFGARAIAMAYSGDVEGGLASLSECIALAEALDHPHSLGHAMVQGLSLTNVAPTHLVSGYAERLLQLGRKFNVAPQQTTASYHLAWVAAELGDRSAGLEQMAALYDRVTATGPNIRLFKIMYVDQLLKADRADDALAFADKALAEQRVPDRGIGLPDLHRLRGDCLAALGRREEAVSDFLRAEALAKRDGAGLLRLRAAVSLHHTDPDKGSRQRLEAALAAFPSSWTGRDVVEARSLLAG